MSTFEYQKSGMTFHGIRGPNTGETGPRVFIGPTDPISDVPVVMDYAHHQVHEGEMFQYNITPQALASGDSLLLRFAVGTLTATTRTPHAIFEVDSTAETWVYLYEGPTLTGNGTAGSAVNRNRNISTAATSVPYINPTVSGNGTLLTSWITGSGTRAGGGTRDSVEWDLKSATNYLYVITSKAASNDVCARLIFYEDLGV